VLWIQHQQSAESRKKHTAWCRVHWQGALEMMTNNKGPVAVIIPLMFGAFSMYIAYFCIKNGEFNFNGRLTARDESPIKFWINVGILIIFGLVFIFVSILSALSVMQM
jgi:hypothetical protein